MNQLEIMQNEDLWPAWPKLPLVKRQRGQLPECALLIANNGATLFYGNIFSPITENTPKTNYATFKDILAAGWEID